MLRKDKPEHQARPRDPPYLDADAGTWSGDQPRPIESQLAALRQMAQQLEHEIDEIFVEASWITGSAPRAARMEVVKTLTANKRKKLARLQSYLAMLEEQAGRKPTG